MVIDKGRRAELGARRASQGERHLLSSRNGAEELSRVQAVEG